MQRQLVVALAGSVAACAVATAMQDGGVDAGSDVAQPDATADAPVKDAAGDATDAANDSAAEAASSFASLQVNEVAPNITANADLIELYAVSGGDIGGITVEQDISTSLVLATLPSITVATGDFIVVHLAASGGVTTETTSKTGCTAAACYPGAWDVVGGSTGITYTGRVLLARGPDAGIQDGVAFYNSAAVSPATFYVQVEDLQDAGQWLPANCSGNPCSTNALAQGISANWAGTGTTTAKSVARAGNADTNTKADWAVGTSSFGATNP